MPVNLHINYFCVQKLTEKFHSLEKIVLLCILN